MKQKLNLSRYWWCQLIGWSLAALYWSFQGWIGHGFRWDIAIAHFFSDIMLYIAITHLYHRFVQKAGWRDLDLQKLLPRIILAGLIMAFVYLVTTSLKIYLIRAVLNRFGQIGFLDFLTENGLGIFMAGIRLMAIWLLAYHLYHYARREARLSMEHHKLSLSFKQAQLDNLSAQLNPHFLFNSLNSIKSLIVLNPALARRGIDLLSELLRSGLYQGDEQRVKLKTELDLVRDYLELEELRMEERLIYDFDVDISLMGKTLPRLSIQTLVENAIKHGLSKLKEGGRIDIVVREEKGLLLIRVVNSGSLLEQTSGLGLKNLKARLELAYKGNAAFLLHQKEQKVFAELHLPL